MELDDVAAESAAAARTAPRVLMCRPEHFTVAYRINPWMHPQQPTDTALALRQWQELYRTYQELGFQVDLIDPEPGLPDMVYAANGGFTLDGIAYTARFRHAERGPEGPAYAQWFGTHGFTVAEAACVNEGEGAGASLPHTHAQLYALPGVPAALPQPRGRYDPPRLPATGLPVAPGGDRRGTGAHRPGPGGRR